MKLSHTDLGYFKHLINALVFSSLSLVSAIVLFVHAFFPFVFKNTGSRLLIRAIKVNTNNSLVQSNHIQIRYNTKSINEKLPWRVLTNNKESLAQDVFILGKAYGEKTYVDKIPKYNLAVDGSITWVGDQAIIISKDS